MATEGRSVGSADEADEDTIELVLSAEDMHLLAQAAAAVQPVASAIPPATEPAASTPLEGRRGLTRLAAALGVSAAAVALVAAAYVVVNVNHESPAPVVAQQATVVAAIPVEPPAPEPQSVPVQFRNPFDATEVFEFPPGTSEAEARDAVADLLMQRARERLGSSENVKRTHRDRTRSATTTSHGTTARY